MYILIYLDDELLLDELDDELLLLLDEEDELEDEELQCQQATCHVTTDVLLLLHVCAHSLRALMGFTGKLKGK
jgi:hypothetical protein